MGLLLDLELDTTNSVLENAYLRIPRTQSGGFFMWERHATFNMEVWESYDVRENVDMGKKPSRVINIRMLDCTHEDIIGSPEVLAVYENGELVSPSIPAKIGLRGGEGKDQYSCSWNEVINDTTLKQFIHDNIMKLGVEESRKLGILNQFYTYIKTENNFCGIDMTTSTNHP